MTEQLPAIIIDRTEMIFDADARTSALTGSVESGCERALDYRSCDVTAISRVTA
jgi:hypothetical protein